MSEQDLKELDKWIAENVMGDELWTVSWDIDDYQEARECFVTEIEAREFAKSIPKSHVYFWAGMCKAYSTSIDKAWDVVKKLRDQKLLVDVMQECNPHKGKFEYHVTVRSFDLTETLHAVIYDESAPFAICLASKKAIEGISYAS
jgi:hypothetical protein